MNTDSPSYCEKCETNLGATFQFDVLEAAVISSESKAIGNNTHMVTNQHRRLGGVDIVVCDYCIRDRRNRDLYWRVPLCVVLCGVALRLFTQVGNVETPVFLTVPAVLCCVAVFFLVFLRLSATDESFVAPLAYSKAATARDRKDFFVRTRGNVFDRGWPPIR